MIADVLVFAVCYVLAFSFFVLPEVFTGSYWLFHSLWHVMMAMGYHELYHQLMAEEEEQDARIKAA